jgi:hypothetical protein
MGSLLRWPAVLGPCVLALSVAVAIAEPASAARDTDKGQPGANVAARGAALMIRARPTRTPRSTAASTSCSRTRRRDRDERRVHGRRLPRERPITSTPPSPPSPPPAPPGGASGGGALGEEGGSAGRGALPFTELPVLLMLPAGLGAAIGAAGVARGTGQEGQGLERRAGEAPDRSHVRHVSAEQALDGAPDDPGPR